MTLELKQFTKKIIIFSLLVAIIEAGVFYFIMPKYYSRTIPFSFIFFIAVSIIAHKLFLNALDKNPAQFNVAFIINFSMKIFIYAIFAGIAFFVDIENSKTIFINIMILYLFYTFFDVREILKVINSKK